MNIRRAALVFVLFTGSAATTGISGTSPLQMEVTPSVTRAPANLTIRLKVDANNADRGLQVVARSETFYRSSEVLVDAKDSPRRVFEFRNLPGGLYQVTATLMTDHGVRATVSKLAKVEPAYGER